MLSSPFFSLAPPTAPPPSAASMATAATGEGTAAGAPKLGVHSAAAALGFHVEGDRPGDDLELSPVPPSSDGEEAVLDVGCESKGAGCAAALPPCSSFDPTAAAASVALGDDVDAVSVMLLLSTSIDFRKHAYVEQEDVVHVHSHTKNTLQRGCSAFLCPVFYLSPSTDD